MPELVALDLPAGEAFVAALRGAWDGGNAVLPIDPRLPGPAVARLVEAMAPTVVVDADGRHRRPSGRPTEPGDALVVPTSGTTGAPKGVVLTEGAVRASALATSARLGVDSRSDRWLACLPLAHIGGLSVVTRSLVTGTPCTVVDRCEPAEIERQARAGATLVSLVATVLGRTDTTGFRTVLLGGAAPPEELPPQVVTTYGLTETGSGVVYDGRPLEGVEVRIGDPAVGVPGEVPGEVMVRGPMLLRAYRDGSDPSLPGGWLPTGDGGRLEVDGTLRVFGRLAEVIVTGGEKVWPAAVEEVLVGHPGISQAAVWKRPDPEWGDRVVAWVVPDDPSAPPTLGQLRELVAAQLSPWAAPRQLVVVRVLPRTDTGKVIRTALA